MRFDVGDELGLDGEDVFHVGYTGIDARQLRGRERHPLRGGRCDGERDDLIGREVREGGQVVVDADEREVGFVLDDLDGVLVRDGLLTLE